VLNSSQEQREYCEKRKTEKEAREGALMNRRMEISDFVDTGESGGSAPWTN
jgi:hypothetical protein